MEEELLREKAFIEKELEAIPKRIKKRRVRGLNIVGMIIFILSTFCYELLMFFMWGIKFNMFSKMDEKSFFYLVVAMVVFAGIPLHIIGTAFLLAHEPLYDFLYSMLSGIVWLALFLVAVFVKHNEIGLVLSFVIIAVYALWYLCGTTVIFALTYPPLKGDTLNVKELNKTRDKLLERYHDLRIALGRYDPLYAEEMRETEQKYMSKKDKEKHNKQKQ